METLIALMCFMVYMRMYSSRTLIIRYDSVATTRVYITACSIHIIYSYIYDQSHGWQSDGKRR